MSVKLSQRRASLDVVRLVAIASVLVVHALECSFQTSPSDMAGMLLGKQILIITLFCFGRLGVPLFLFLTGYLMLDRKYDLANLKSFYKERVGRLLIITWIWVTIYYAVGVLVLDRKPAPASYLRQLLFMQDSFAPQMWYMPMIIGLYIFIPMLANILPQLRGRTIVGLLGVGGYLSVHCADSGCTTNGYGATTIAYYARYELFRLSLCHYDDLWLSS